MASGIWRVVAALDAPYYARRGTRRPSHADKRRAWRREMLAAEILAVMRAGPSDVEIQAAADRLLRLAA